MYTDRQLCEIILLVQAFCLTADGDLWQCQYKVADNIWTTSTLDLDLDPLTNF